MALLTITSHSQKKEKFHSDKSQVVLVTGAASGIGKATVEKFENEGHQVYATDIDTTNLSKLQCNKCIKSYLDVTDEASIIKTIQDAEKNHGGIDILVNNAGYGQNGVIEELSLDDLRRQFEVNVFGLLRVTQEVLPNMRKKKAGRIINIGSVGSDFTSPGASAYHASKYALESFNDGLRQELYPFGIDVILIKPGGVNTNFTENSIKHYPNEMEDSPYLDFRTKFLEMTETILDPEKSSYPILEAEEVAEVIYKSALRKKPKTKYRVGITSKLMPMVKAFKSDKGLDKMMLKQVGVYKGNKAQLKQIKENRN